MKVSLVGVAVYDSCLAKVPVWSLHSWLRGSGHVSKIRWNSVYLRTREYCTELKYSIRLRQVLDRTWGLIIITTLFTPSLRPSAPPHSRWPLTAIFWNDCERWSIHQSIHPWIHPSIQQSFHHSLPQSIYTAFYVFIILLFHPTAIFILHSIHPFINHCPSFPPFLNLSAHSSIHPFLILPSHQLVIHPSVFPSSIHQLIN